MFAKLTIIACVYVIYICYQNVFITASDNGQPLNDTTDETYQNDCLYWHNYYRSLHQNTAPPVRNNWLVNIAKGRCQDVSKKPGLSAGHSGLTGNIGENLFWVGAPGNVNFVAPCKNALIAWHEEIRFYNYSKPGFYTPAAHFTQLVWNSSSQVGCARCSGNGGKYYETYIVCNYLLQGNIIGVNFATEVFPLKPTSG